MLFVCNLSSAVEVCAHIGTHKVLSSLTCLFSIEVSCLSCYSKCVGRLVLAVDSKYVVPASSVLVRSLLSEVLLQMMHERKYVFYIEKQFEYTTVEIALFSKYLFDYAGTFVMVL